MNQKIVKQVAGIDVAQNELVVSLGRMYEDLSTEIYSYKVFVNSAKGFLDLVNWVKKLSDPDAGLQFVMEATGVYHESLAYFLTDKGYHVSIVLPNKISNYMRTLETKTITDKTASQAIAMFGLERKLSGWKQPSKMFKQLRQLTRERDQVIELRVMSKNHLHAEQAEAEPNKGSIDRIKKQILFFTNQEAEIRSAIQQLINGNVELKAIVVRSCSIPGVGVLTAATVLAETNGFDLIRNKKQLTSYAGLDVQEKQSGTSVKGKARISKKGNRYLRKCLHMPALTAIRHDDRFKAIFARLVSKHGIKMKAAVAVQRKLLEMIYTLYKTNTTYNKDYLKKLESDRSHSLNRLA
jgi:transposase